MQYQEFWLFVSICVQKYTSTDFFFNYVANFYEFWKVVTIHWFYFVKNRYNQYIYSFCIFFCFDLLTIDAFLDQDNTPIILGVIIPIIIIILLFLFIIVLRRRRSATRKATESRTNDNMSLPDSVIETSRPIRIENFANHYRLMSADSDFR